MAATEERELQMQMEGVQQGGSVWDAPVPRGFRRNERGDLVRAENIRPRDLDMDRAAMKIYAFARDLSEQMGRFKAHTMEDIAGFAERVVADYGGKIGGRKGNIQLTSFDGCVRVQLAQASFLSVGPEIIAVRELLDQLIERWGKGAPKEFRALVEAALRPNADGEISVSKLLELRRAEIDAPEWRQVQEAIADCISPRGRAEYVRVYRRDNPERGWEQLPLSLANVPAAAGAGAPRGVLKRRLWSAVRQARLDGLNEGDIKAAFEESRMHGRRRRKEGGHDDAR